MKILLEIAEETLLFLILSFNQETELHCDERKYRSLKLDLVCFLGSLLNYFFLRVQLIIVSSLQDYCEN